MKEKQLFSGILKVKISLLFLGLIWVTLSVAGQGNSITVTKTSFSSDQYDEFAPVYFNGGMVFCTNRNTGMAEYSNSQNKGLLKIFYVDSASNGNWQIPRLFSRELKTRLNDGPITFNRSKDTVYFSRNLIIDERIKQMVPASNRLGIFFAVKEGKKWARISEMRFNNEWYNITAPCLSQDGKRLYFASDKPDGFGGMDIYYSQFVNGYWGDPVNLGPEINTPGNESYPFINQAGELFFSSDGHPGLGGKDIFVSKSNGREWYTPVRLQEPINSEYDDFGMLTDQFMKKGYFASNRDKSVDIYSFSIEHSQVWFSELQDENQYCYKLSGQSAIKIDTAILSYLWDLGDGVIQPGLNVNHCFPGPGKYNVKLDVLDKHSGNLFLNMFTLVMEIINPKQAVINSPDFSMPGDTIEMNGLSSYFPDDEVLDYIWEFGDGTFGKGGSVKHVFETGGEYYVKLGLVLKSKKTGNISKPAVSKRIIVFTDPAERSLYISMNGSREAVFYDISGVKNARLQYRYSAEADFAEGAVFQVVLLSDMTQRDKKDVCFSKVPAKYYIREIHDQKTGEYSYVIDQQSDVMETYPAYRDAVANGYTDARVRLFIPDDPAEKELINLAKTNGVLTDKYFDITNRMLTDGYIMLDQLVLILNKYPKLKLEVGVHTDNYGMEANNLSTSQIQAQVIISYLTGRGISSNRLTAKGYGSSRPVRPNAYPTDRRLNRRIEFTIVR